MNKDERVANLFSQGFSCSQSVLLAFAEEYGLTHDLAARVAAGFGGGMGRQGRTCGAVTGAMMVIGLEQGATSAADKQAKEETYDLVRLFLEAFKARYGTLECKDLVGVDISTDEGLAQARQQGRFASCPGFVKEAASILNQMLPCETHANNTADAKSDRSRD